MSVSEREIQKELREHPWASRELAMRIALDHNRHKTTTKEGKRLYMKEYMRQKRQKLRIPIPKALGKPSEAQIPNLLGVITGKGRKK